MIRRIGACLACATILGCLSPAPEGLMATPEKAPTTVKFDFYAKPLPEIPLPNDLATRFDATSPTKRRLNASLVTPTAFNSGVRAKVDELDGWGLFQYIQVPFTGPLSVESILNGHSEADYDLANDVVYLIDIDRDSEHFGEVFHLDMGQGNYPQTLEKTVYWKNDSRHDRLSLLLEELDEDKNGNGVLDLGGDGELSEDLDADGVLDKPNYRPGAAPADDDLAGRADAMMTFYESETHTLLVKPLVPLRERTTYAVVITRRLLDINGDPVGSPFELIHHASQSDALAPLPEVLPAGTEVDDVAFAFTFTTQTTVSDWVAVRDGLYGHGVQGHIGQEFPAELDRLLPLRSDEQYWGEVANPYVMYGEEFQVAYNLIATQLQGTDGSSVAGKATLAAQGYVDYQAFGGFLSPQLFERYDDEGNFLPYNDQKWPADLESTPAKTRAEEVFFTLLMPRREVSVRGENAHAPVVIVGHGYTGSRFDALNFGGYLAKHGLATIAIDNISHGINIDKGTEELANQLLLPLGMGEWTDAVLSDRKFDQNNDGEGDSGADFWSSYLFHTRDAVRQSALDYMQLVRVIRSFDGVRRWKFDVNGDGEPDLAGDFDGDGHVDIGKNSTISMLGGSLGGMMSTYMGSLEPEIDAVVPIAAGGGLADLGSRSQQGGVREAFILRALCPVYTGTPQEDGSILVETIVPDLNDTAELPVTSLTNVVPGDAVRIENLANGEIGCANVLADGTFRGAVESDLGDPIRLTIYDGPALAGDAHCGIREGYAVKQVVEEQTIEFVFQGETYPAGQPIVAMAEGFGMLRASPDLRRLFGLGQLISDPADMSVVARHMQLEPLHYPATDQTTGAHMMLITTLGDMAVPVSGGMSIARAAGLLPYTEVDERYGVPANQVLLDNYAAEAAHTIGRFHDNQGNPVHKDVEVLSDGDDVWTPLDIPRLDKPLRLVVDEDKVCDERGCGASWAMFPFPHPTGQHGFDTPGEWTDRGRKNCKDACTEEGDDPCGCKTLETFDIGFYLFNMAGHYMATGGRVIDRDHCNSRDDCDYFPDLPPARDVNSLK